MEFRTTLKSNRQQFVVVLYCKLFKKVTCTSKSFSFSECRKKYSVSPSKKNIPQQITLFIVLKHPI